MMNREGAERVVATRMCTVNERRVSGLTGSITSHPASVKKAINQLFPTQTHHEQDSAEYR